MSEWFYSLHVCEEMKKLQMERKRIGSLNAIVFSCGTVIIYLTGVDVQQRFTLLTESRLDPVLHQPCQHFLHTPPFSNYEHWHKLDGKSLHPNTDPDFVFGSIRSNVYLQREGPEPGWKLVRMQLVTAHIS